MSLSVNSYVGAPQKHVQKRQTIRNLKKKKATLSLWLCPPFFYIWWRTILRPEDQVQPTWSSAATGTWSEACTVDEFPCCRSRIPASISGASSEELLSCCCCCCSSNDCLQVGHDECDSSHVSIHLTWKPWLHLGNTLTFSPSMNSPRQIGQSVAFILIPELYMATGIWRNALLFSPVAARRAAVSTGVSKANLLPQRKAQRTMEFSPRAHISAQSNAARMITMLVSKLASLVKELRVLFPSLDVELNVASRRWRCGRCWRATIAN